MRKGLALESGDILFNATNSPELVGKTALFCGYDEPVTFSNHFIRVRLDRMKAWPAYVTRYLQLQFDRGIFAGMCRQWVNQATVTKDQLAGLPIPLPPLEEQRRIAAILDKADALRRTRKRALALLDTLTQSIFLEMFGDLRLEHKRWPTIGFSEACKDITSRSEKLQRAAYEAEGKFPVVDQGQAFPAGWTSEPSLVTHVQRPVVAFGDHTRAVRFVDFDFVVGADGLKVLAPSDRYEPRFFAEMLKGLPLPDLGYSRHMREVKRLAFPAPPIDLQSSFVQRLRVIDSVRHVHSRHAEKQSDLFTSLQSRAFTGQL